MLHHRRVPVWCDYAGYNEDGPKTKTHQTIPGGTHPWRIHRFDVVSKVDRQEVDNALNQAAKELATRFDFRGTDTSIAWQGEETIAITSVHRGARQGRH